MVEWRSIISKFLIVFIIFIFFIISFSPLSQGIMIEKVNNPVSIGKILNVGGSGPDNYTRIMDGVVDADPYDTVFVYDDSSPYYENINISKPIFLIGENRDTTIIDGNHTGNVVYIQANEVLVSGFTIKNCKSSGNEWKYCTIKIIHSENVVIKDNKISVGDIEYNDWVAGIILQGSSYNQIQNNIIFDGVRQASVGIEIRENSTSNNISSNEILDYNYGIDLNSRNNTIYGNNIHHTINGIFLGIYADRNKIVDNIINKNRGSGIVINADDNIVTENSITNNGEGGEFDCGIEVDGSSNDIKFNIISDNNPIGVFIWDTDSFITNNHISNNHQIGIFVFFSHGCIIKKNNLIDNGNNNAFFENDFIHSSSNRWRRNYWSDKHGLFTYRIKGFIYLGGLYLLQIPWMNFDLLPAHIPYDIYTVITK